VPDLENFLTATCCIFQVNFANDIAPLTKLDVLQFPLVYACVLPRMTALSEETGYTPTQKTLSDGGRGPHSQGIQSSVFKPHHHFFSMKHASSSLTVSASGFKGVQR
jgi:hypothetical protein